MKPARADSPDAAVAPSATSRAVVAGLVLAAVLPPAALVAVPGVLALLGPLPTAVSLIGALVVAPAASGIVAALLGLGRVRGRFRNRADTEHEQAILRVPVAAALLAYAIGLAAFAPASAAAAPSLLTAVLALASGWTVLLQVILSPVPAVWRRNAAIVLDMAILSVFLHVAGGFGAAWYPLYLVAIFYAGFRLGLGALAVAAAAALAGFAATVALTPFWQEQRFLVAGLFVALALLPGLLALLIRAIAASQAQVAAARAEAAAALASRDRFVTVIGRGLRGPLEAMLAATQPEPAGEALPPRALLSQIGEVLDLATIEAGEFSPAAETFDLHAIINDAVALLRGAAAVHGISLAVRIDPAVPYRLYGWPQQLAQIVNSLAIEAIAASAAGTIRIDVDAAAVEGGPRGDIVRLRLAVRDHAGATAAAGQQLGADPFAPGAGGHDGFALAVMRRLVELMGGRVTLAEAPGQGRRWTVTLPFALDGGPEGAGLDLGGRPVLLVTEDSQFAGELAEPLSAWNADARWIGGLDDALVYVERVATEMPPVLVVDGRARVLPALSFVHRAALAREEPPFILFVADAAQLASLADLGDGEIAGLLPAPLDELLLENALHALPLLQGAAMPAPLPEPEPEPEAETGADDRVTPIAAHPRFAAETATVVDRRVVAALQSLGTGEFLAEVIDSFRADTRAIMDRLGAAATGTDAAAFARALQALRRAATMLGGARIVELAQALRDISAGELRQHGAAIVQRLGSELARLEAALREELPTARPQKNERS